MSFFYFRITVFFIILSFHSLFAQIKGDYQWPIGYDISSTQTKTGLGTRIDFKGDTIQFRLMENQAAMGTAVSAISDSNGDLLFYSNGCDIFNKDDEVMDGGENLYVGEGFVYDCKTGDNSFYSGIPFSQANIIVPFPKREGIYYLFYFSLVYDHEHETSTYPLWLNKIQYALVDMNENNGLGKVIEKDKLLWEDEYESQLMTIRADNDNTWLLGQRPNSNMKIKFLITDKGIEGPFMQAIGQKIWNWGADESKFSPNGKVLARYASLHGLKLYDFDRSSGEISNYRHVDLPEEIENKPPYNMGGLEFSPNGRFIYCRTWDAIYQIDLTYENLEEGVVKVAENDGFIHENRYKSNFYYMQRGPDCRIYITLTSSHPFLHVIDKPDLKGEACNVIQRVALPTWNGGSLPNFPNFRVDEEMVCDSSKYLDYVIYEEPTAVFNTDGGQIQTLLYPNPTQGKIKLRYEYDTPISGIFRLYNMSGVLVFEEELVAHRGEEGLDLRGLGKGLFIWEIESGDHKPIVGKLFIESE